MHRTPIVTLLVAGAVLCPRSAPASAAEVRLRTTVEAALGHSPSLQISLLELELRRSDVEQARFPGSPSLEWQREGIGPAFSHRANAQLSTRLAAPFNVPLLHTGPARRLGEAALGVAATGSRAAVLAAARETSAAWLELASVTERIAIVARRLDHLDRALVVEVRRLDLGEVAGSDVLQLELERAGEASRLHALRADHAAWTEVLARMCGGPPEVPEIGDLEALAGLTETPAGASDLLKRVDGAPELRLAAAEAEAETARAALVRTTAWGRPEAEVEWEHFPALGGAPGYDAIGLRLALPLPLGRSGSAARHEADTRRALADLAARERRLEVERRVSVALVSAEAAASRLEDLGPVRGRLPASEHSLAEQFRLGAISYLAYLDGLARHDSILLEAVDATLELLAARLELAVTLDDPRWFPLPTTTPAEASP